jgi:histone acetyltransferase
LILFFVVYLYLIIFNLKLKGATLMGCELNPKIVYTEFSAVVRRQKEILKKLIERKQAQIRKVHPGLTCFKDGVREIPIESIPGIIEAGWVPPADRGSERKTRTDTSDPDVLYNALKTILNATKSNQYAWPFQTPVDRKMVSMIYYSSNFYPLLISIKIKGLVYI